MIATRNLSVRGIPTRVLDAGAGGLATVFLHGGTPGVTPYCGGSHLWGEVLADFARDRRVVAIDLPGAGGTGMPEAGLTIDAMAAHVAATLDVIGIPRCHLVGHDLGGLIALSIASQHPARVQAVTTVASVAASPTGDSLENLTFAHPPDPRWSRGSQRWALERISYSHHHIGPALLDACMEAAAGAAHRAAQEWMSSGAHGDVFMPSLMSAKSRFYELCRGKGMPVPAQVIWGMEDPLGSFEQGMWLYRLAARHQKASHFHAINRAGSMPFREEPRAFHSLVSAFAEGLADA